MDQHTPGGGIIDLRSVAEERDRIWSALFDAYVERDHAEYEANIHSLDDNRCSNECVCTIAEKIEAQEYEGAWAMIPMLADGEDSDGMWETAGLDSDDSAFMVAVHGLEDDIGDPERASEQGHPAMILDDYFIEYAEQLAGDIGAIDPDAGWPLSHIDWQEAAEALQVDYTSVEFGGYTYWWGP